MKLHRLIAVLLAGASVLGFAENAARVVHYHSNDIVAVTTHGYEFAACVQRANIYATQFHPEKSHKYGLRLIQNFIERV